jgi:two-component system CheB/CheR fusion protein
VEQDFLHSLRGLPYNDVRAAIDTVFRERTAVTLNDLEVDRATPNGPRFLTLSITVLQAENLPQDTALVSVLDQSEQVQTRRRLESVQKEQLQTVAELSTANKRLSDMNKDLQDANEELQAANEEMMLTQEELQAANEELEATNDELTARTQDLQDVLETLASERVRLSEMIELAPFYILVLRGPSLNVEACNTRYARLLAGREYLGRPVDEVFRGQELTVSSA